MLQQSLGSHDCEWEVGGDECLVLKEVDDGLFKRAVVGVYFEVDDLVQEVVLGDDIVNTEVAYGCPFLLVDANVGDLGVRVFLESFLELIDFYVLRKIVDVDSIVEFECISFLVYGGALEYLGLVYCGDVLVELVVLVCELFECSYCLSVLGGQLEDDGVDVSLKSVCDDLCMLGDCCDNFLPEGLVAIYGDVV